MRKVIYAHLALISLNILYSGNHLLAKGIMPENIGPNGFVVIRSVSTAILFSLIFFLFIREKIEKKDRIKLILTGFLGVGISQVLFFNGIANTSALNVGILMTSVPIFTVIFSYFYLKEKVTILKIAGVLLGAIGAIALTTIGKAQQFDSSLGDLYIILNGICFAAYLVLVKPLMKKYKPLTVVSYHFIFGSLFIMCFPPVWSELSIVDFTVIPFDIWMKMIYVIIGATFITYLLNIFALRHLSPSVSGSYVYSQPVFVMLFTFLFTSLGWIEDFSGAITLEKIGFMLLIFLGVFLISYSTNSTSRTAD